MTSGDTTGQISAAIAGISTFLKAGGTADQQDVWIDRMKALLPHISDHESEILRSRAVNALTRSITFRRPNYEVFSFLESQAERILEESTSPASKAEAACTLLASYWWIGDAARCEELVGSQVLTFEDSSISSATKLWWLHWRMQYQSFLSTKCSTFSKASSHWAASVSAGLSLSIIYGPTSTAMQDTRTWDATTPSSCMMAR